MVRPSVYLNKDEVQQDIVTDTLGNQILKKPQQQQCEVILV